MKKLFMLLSAVIMMVNMYHPVFAEESNGAKKTKTVWVIDSISEEHEKATVRYTKGGLIKEYESVNTFGITEYRSKEKFIYNKNNLLTKIKYLDKDGNVTRITKYTYSGTNVKNTAYNHDSIKLQGKISVKYNWKSGAKKLTIKEVQTTGDDGYWATTNYKLGADKRILKASGESSTPSGSVYTFTNTYKYNKDGYLTKEVNKGKEDDYEVINSVTTCKYKKDKKGNITKATYQRKGSSRKTVFKYHYKKIAVPKENLDLIKLQQKTLIAQGYSNWMVGYEVLTAK